MGTVDSRGQDFGGQDFGGGGRLGGRGQLVGQLTLDANSGDRGLIREVRCTAEYGRCREVGEARQVGVW